MNLPTKLLSGFLFAILLGFTACSDSTDTTTNFLATGNGNADYLSPVIIFSEGDINSGQDIDIQIYYLDTVPNVMTALDSTQMAQMTMVDGSMHTRGMSTAQSKKKQYKVGLDHKPAHGHFLGMPHGGTDWVFNDAGTYDHTYLRNQLMFQMQRSMGDWAPRTKFFELFVVDVTKLPGYSGSGFDAVAATSAVLADPMNYYQGLYLNMEKIKDESHRIDISVKPYPTDNSMGPIIIQVNQNSSKYYQIQPGTPLTLTSNTQIYRPKVKDLSDTAAYLSTIRSWYHNNNSTGWADRFVSIYNDNLDGSNQCPTWDTAHFPDSMMTVPIVKELTSPNNASNFTAIRQSTDYASFARYFLLAELARDQDGYHKSTFMYTDYNTDSSDVLVYAGPMWDKNKSLGNWSLDAFGAWCCMEASSDSAFYADTVGWSYCMNAWGQSPVWWEVMLMDTMFCRVVYETWDQYTGTNGVLTYPVVQDSLNVWQSLIYAPSNSPVARDSALYGQKEFPFYSAMNDMTTYIEGRFKWIDANLLAMLKFKSGYEPK